MIALATIEATDGPCTLQVHFRLCRNLHRNRSTPVLLATQRASCCAQGFLRFPIHTVFRKWKTLRWTTLERTFPLPLRHPTGYFPSTKGQSTFPPQIRFTAWVFTFPFAWRNITHGRRPLPRHAMHYVRPSLTYRDSPCTGSCRAS